MSLSQKILTGFIVCTIILVIVAVFSFRNSEKFIETNQWINHTHEVLDEFNQILTATIDAETGVRGFVISGDEVFLEPYNNFRQNIVEHLDKVKKLIADNPSQQKNIESLQNQLNIHSKYFEDLITTRKSDFEKARQIVSTQEGKRIQDEIRRMIANSIEIETALLVVRKKTSEEDARNFNWIFIMLLVVISVVLITVYFIINTNLRALKKAEQESANKNWLLSGNFELNEK